MCYNGVIVGSSMTYNNDVIVTHILVPDRNIFFQQKVRGDVGENRNLLLSAIRRNWHIYPESNYARNLWLLQVIR